MICLCSTSSSAECIQKIRQRLVSTQNLDIFPNPSVQSCQDGLRILEGISAMPKVFDRIELHRWRRRPLLQYIYKMAMAQHSMRDDKPSEQKSNALVRM